jgi:hypothetical protein
MDHMAELEQNRSVDKASNEGSEVHNLDAVISIWSAVGAVALLLVYGSIRRTAILVAVPVAGLSATIFGFIGMINARRVGNGRSRSFVGLLTGIAVLIASGIFALFLWEISRTDWQF